MKIERAHFELQQATWPITTPSLPRNITFQTFGTAKTFLSHLFGNHLATARIRSFTTMGSQMTTCVGLEKGSEATVAGLKLAQDLNQRFFCALEATARLKVQEHDVYAPQAGSDWKRKSHGI